MTSKEYLSWAYKSGRGYRFSRFKYLILNKKDPNLICLELRPYVT